MSCLRLQPEVSWQHELPPALAGVDSAEGWALAKISVKGFRLKPPTWLPAPPAEAGGNSLGSNDPQAIHREAVIRRQFIRRQFIGEQSTRRRSTRRQFIRGQFIGEQSTRRRSIRRQFIRRQFIRTTAVSTSQARCQRTTLAQLVRITSASRSPVFSSFTFQVPAWTGLSTKTDRNH